MRVPSEPGTDARLHPTSRSSPAQLAERLWDLLIIGGGWTGALLARAAAQRGLRTALVEQDRLGAGATGAWHGLLTGGGHGGDPLRTTAEQRRSRDQLRSAAPHLVQPAPLLAPDWTSDPWPRRWRAATLVAHELAGPSANLRVARSRSKHEMLAAEPSLRARGLSGGLAATPWQADAARLTLALARAAALNGAAIATHAAAETFLSSNGRISGASVLDRLDGTAHAVHATVTVFAGGAGPAPGEAAPSESYECRRIALLAKRVDVQSHLLIQSALDGMLLLLQRDGDHVLAGPVHPVRGHGDSLAWVTALLRGINAALPTARLSHGDVLGLRAAPVQGDVASLAEREDGLLRITSGPALALPPVVRQTTARVEQLVRDSKRAAPAELGAILDALPGGDAHDLTPIAHLGKEAGLDPASTAHCLRAYGTEAAAIFNMAQRDRALRGRLHPESPAILAEVIHAARRGFAATVADVLDGALGLDLRTRDGGAAAAEACAAQLGRELDWPPDKAASEAAAHVAATARAASRIAHLGA